MKPQRREPGTGLQHPQHDLTGRPGAADGDVARCRGAAARGDHHGALSELRTLAKPLCDSGAVRSFLELLDALPPAQAHTDLDLLLRAGTAWTELTAWQRAAACYRRAHRLATDHGTAPDLAQVVTAQGVLAWYRGDIPEARRLLDRASRLLSGTVSDDPAWDELREGQALVHSAHGELDRAETLLRIQLRTFQRRADAEGQRHVLANAAVLVALRRGDFDHAEALLEEALALAEEYGLQLGLPRTLNCLAFVLNWQGRHDEAHGHARRALHEGHRLHVPHAVCFAEYNQAVALGHRGETTAALDACDRALRALRTGSSSLLRADVLLARARLERPHSPRRAADTARTAVHVARTQQDRWTLGVCLLELADIDGAAAGAGLLAEAGALFRRYGDRHQSLRWHTVAARHAHDRGDMDALAGHVTTLVTDMGRYPGLTPLIAGRLRSLLPPVADRVAAALPAAEGGGDDSLAPLAADLLASPDERVRTWAVAALSARPTPRAYALLAGHHDDSAAVRARVDETMTAAAAEPLPGLDLLCLGGYEVRAGAPVPPDRWTSLHAQLILVYLAANGGATRDELLDLLWPEDDVRRTEVRLRSTMRLLRHALRPPWRPDANYVEHRAGSYRIAHEVRVTTDFARFEAQVGTARSSTGRARRQACGDALALYRGDLLPGFGQDWVRRERERLALDWLWTLEEHAADLLAAGACEEAEVHARRVIGRDPLRERAWRVLMEVCARQDRRAEAVRSYLLLRERLREELATEPSPATQRLYTAITGDRRPGAVG
ncbi:BTAD domain-containing putative transcriptional regulator [Streptomyces sp. DSM 42041]|uniref:BTAD domain-containing putative transcriptional regulator n=1 Tax=Streptomyces hazeniae TaxID=3075538 RepID=A0ABU2NY16_9ACTN|nr:BTAD domain-containing putative transcriptional regulator [Streptomyces sp. DSM 42041]MDT0381884.1 BTAD domain-containing putative transcriptional regulator [Streptomyces sp. DSM 42041]